MPTINARTYIVDEDIAKVSLVGTGMKSSPGVAAKAFETLGQNDINILAISTSPIRLSVVVDAAQAAQAVQCLHTAFGLDSDSVFVETQLSAEEIAAKMNKGREGGKYGLDEGYPCSSSCCCCRCDGRCGK